MRLGKADASADKGWFIGPWNSDMPIPIGYANKGIDEPHEHCGMFEVYLVACGTAVARIEHESVTLSSGDVLVVEPGEAHTFLESSADYLHFVIHVPQKDGLLPARAKEHVDRSRLGL